MEENFPKVLQQLNACRLTKRMLPAAVAVNSELVLLYWSIGADILSRQHQEGSG
jgi:hypothetical protein